MSRARLLLVLLIALAVGASSVPPSSAATTIEPPAKSLRWLNLGDSYAAGEGATAGAGPCQRSANAAGPKAATILRRERSWNIKPDVFSACTGYWAADVYNSRKELQVSSVRLGDSTTTPGEAKHGAELSNDDSLHDWAVKLGAREKSFDVIVLSVSGNDIGFADIVTGCTDIVRNLGHGANSVLPNVTASPWEAFARASVVPQLIDRADEPGCGEVVGAQVRARIDALFTGDPFPSSSASPLAGSRGSLVDIYTSLADTFLADGGVLIVMGYPRLIVPSNTWGRWRGGQCNMISAADADALGSIAEYYDQRMRSNIEALDDRFEFVSRLEIFDDGGTFHSLCGRTVEWINTPLLFLRDGTLRKERAFHPNDLGYLATAEDVAGVVEARLGVRPTPPPEATPSSSPPATVRSSESHFGIGDSFDSECVVAWPTAPSRGASSIQMRTSCSGVPSQFLFVDIVYDDPDLAVSPSRSRMKVRGKIADIVRSEYGFTTLVVYASAISVL